jgi:serine/threonine protein kinase
MEYCRHGDLHHYLTNHRFLPAADVQQLTYQVLEGLHQMHQNDFAHRDLKPGVSVVSLSSDYLVTLPEHPHQIKATGGELVDSTRRFRYQ